MWHFKKRVYDVCISVWCYYVCHVVKCFYLVFMFWISVMFARVSNDCLILLMMFKEFLWMLYDVQCVSRLCEWFVYECAWFLDCSMSVYAVAWFSTMSVCWCGCIVALSVYDLVGFVYDWFWFVYALSINFHDLCMSLSMLVLYDVLWVCMTCVWSFIEFLWCEYACPISSYVLCVCGPYACVWCVYDCQRVSIICVWPFVLKACMRVQWVSMIVVCVSLFNVFLWCVYDSVYECL